MLEAYVNRTPSSRGLWERARRLFAGGVNHNIRTFGMVTAGAYPPFLSHGKGSHVWDIDGNEYVDWWMTHYADILGHSHPVITKAIRDQAQKAVHLGGLTGTQVVFGEAVNDAIPMLELMRFCTTGSEATMYASGIARVFTGRRLIAKAIGGWHGGNDTLAYHIKHPFADESLVGGVSFDFNDRESVDAMLKTHGHQLAAVIVEPVLGAGGAIPPEDQFLNYLREETESRDILLIFDEIVTGFRLAYGDAGTKVFGVRPDLITLGKAAGGGMPLGVYGGREDVMRLAAPGTPGGRWVGGGTFSSHPLTMAAGTAALGELRRKSDDYRPFNRQGDLFREELNSVFQETGTPAIATGMGSIVFITVLRKRLEGTHLTGSRLGAAMDNQLQDVFQALLMHHGVLGYHGLGAMSFAHSRKDLDKTVEGVREAIDSLQKGLMAARSGAGQCP
ncbi:MAG: aminotransferase class III-fold pyridoxal phosphate-dependent enzyme [Candidatus Thorarchaeota archaeon]|nr:aminotransferase class III-fold pyridoxal phosphate-dependent enzyme [Candidatus Thorarchaeota archaeon]